MALHVPALSDLPSAFALHDRDRDGRITFEEMLRVLRSCGFAPTNEEDALLARAVREAYGGSLTLAAAITLAESLAARCTPSRTAAAAGILAFQRLVRGAGTKTISPPPVSLEDLHLLLTRCGDDLSQRDFLALARHSLSDQWVGAHRPAAIDTERFLTRLLGPPAGGETGGVCGVGVGAGAVGAGSMMEKV